VEADRVIFAPKTSYEAHTARLQAADLGLDTFPYNGHTTTSDQLWAGLPVLTVKGSNFASRVSESLLTAIGLHELVAPDLETFVAQAIALSNDPARLARLKQTIEAKRYAAPLFDAERFCRHLETAYGMMADRARQKLAPEHFDVPALPARTSPFR
jgi:predicted O-linked N-acetylglucosamine transferase (SPINDLY family)